ncbi:MAG: hypothetical protein D6755_04995 [Anaerolineae bacterium]|nr:MAG: hypothetical protein D6755_04995 [Anaerolineae bacterium]
MELENLLRHNLYRYECPDALTLGEYHNKLLPSVEQRRIRKHVEKCPHCQQELQTLQQFLKEAPLPEPPGVVERIAQEIEVFVGRLLPPRPAFQVRGMANSMRYYEVLDLGQITLDVQELPGGVRSLVGLMLGIPPSGFEASLWNGDVLLQTVPVSALGNFVFENVSSGRYYLLLKNHKCEIHLLDVSV